LQREIVTSDIVCDNGMPAFVARPASPGPHPVYVLMHERYGLVRHTRDLAMRCARDGFFAMAPDFFFRHPDRQALNAGTSRYDLTDPEAVDYLRAALATVGRDKAADPARIAVGGYCQTGRHPLVFAAEIPIAAAVVWYGAASRREWLVNERQPQPLADLLARITCPVFAAFGADDHIISLDDVRRFRDTLEARRKSYDINLYHGAPHGWLNDTMPGRYRMPQAEAGWAAQQAFLSRVMDGKPHDGRVNWSFRASFPPDYDFSKNVRLE